MLLYVIVIIVFIVVLAVIIEFNKFTRLRNKVKHSKSTIDVYLNKRFDLIPNLVECVKAYSKYEQSTFEKVTQMRAEYEKNNNLDDGAKTYTELNKVIGIIEKYPELKASDQFLDLQKSLRKIEDELQAARRLYNGDVTLYNTTLETFPDSVFANVFSFEKEKLFEIEDYKKENIKIDM
jgi:LemA protein